MKSKSSIPNPNPFPALEEDNGNSMDDLVDYIMKKVEAPPRNWDMIFGEDIRRRNSKEYSSSLLSAAGGMNYEQRGHFKNQCSALKEKLVMNVATSDFEDELSFRVEEYVESWVVGHGALFHATASKGTLKNLKVRLGYVVLKTSLDIVCLLNDVRFIPRLERMFNSVGQLGNKGYHIIFGYQRWKVVKGRQVIACGFKRRTMYMFEIPVKEWLGWNFLMVCVLDLIMGEGIRAGDTRVNDGGDMGASCEFVADNSSQPEGGIKANVDTGTTGAD
ncbi:hypothetical protein Tco_1023471 [Tanacetum coccineum]